MSAATMVAQPAQLLVGPRRLTFDDAVAQPRLGRMRHTHP
jgi:hypothetical protein